MRIVLPFPPHRSLRRRGVLFGSGALLAAPSIVRAQGQTGVALVIGNSKYKWEASLPNAKRDATDVAKAFQALGLKTELVQDVGRDAMFAALEKFKAAAQGANLAAFYFAGHGAFWEKETYLVPEDADLANPATVRTLLPVGSIAAALQGARHRLLVFDSCRNNPADGWRQKDAMIQARFDDSMRANQSMIVPDTLTLFSTAPGMVALDGPAGENSPFAAAFLRQLNAPSIDLQAMGALLRRDLLLATECRQMVWEQNTYAAPFVLKGAGKTVPRTEPAGVVELSRLYEYARQNKLPVPAGLVALRLGNSHDSKIGTFSFENMALNTIRPAYIAVLSASDKVAQAILGVIAADNLRMKEFTARWRFLQLALSDRMASWESVDGMARSEFRWKDANSGSYTTLPLHSNHTPYSSRLVRLDG